MMSRNGREMHRRGTGARKRYARFDFDIRNAKQLTPAGAGMPPDPPEGGGYLHNRISNQASKPAAEITSRLHSSWLDNRLKYATHPGGGGPLIENARSVQQSQTAIPARAAPLTVTT